MIVQQIMVDVLISVYRLLGMLFVLVEMVLVFQMTDSHAKVTVIFFIRLLPDIHVNQPLFNMAK